MSTKSLLCEVIISELLIKNDRSLKMINCLMKIQTNTDVRIQTVAEDLQNLSVLCSRFIKNYKFPSTALTRKSYISHTKIFNFLKILHIAP